MTAAAGKGLAIKAAFSREGGQPGSAQPTHSKAASSSVDSQPARTFLV